MSKINMDVQKSYDDVSSCSTQRLSQIKLLSVQADFINSDHRLAVALAK